MVHLAEAEVVAPMVVEAVTEEEEVVIKNMALITKAHPAVVQPED